MDCLTFGGRRGGGQGDYEGLNSGLFSLFGCLGIIFTHGVWMCIQVGSQVVGKVCQGCIAEIVRCRKLILGRDIG